LFFNKAAEDTSLGYGELHSIRIVHFCGDVYWITIEGVDVFVARNISDIEHAFDRLRGSPVVGCDTETSGLTAKYGKLFSIQFSDGSFNVLIPISEGVAIGKLAEILTDLHIIKIFHNAKFDLEFLSAIDITPRNIFDTMVAEKVLTRGANQSSSLAETLYRYFAVDLDKSQRTKFIRKWNGIWTDELVAYALSDVVHLPRLMSAQNAWLEKLGLTAEYATQMNKVITSDGRPDALL